MPTGYSWTIAFCLMCCYLLFVCFVGMIESRLFPLDLFPLSFPCYQIWFLSGVLLCWSFYHENKLWLHLPFQDNLCGLTLDCYILLKGRHVYKSLLVWQKWSMSIDRYFLVNVSMPSLPASASTRTTSNCPNSIFFKPFKI